MKVKKLLAAVLAVAMILGMMSFPAFAEEETAGTFSGGEGTSASPYIIGGYDDLTALAGEVNGGNDYKGKYFKIADGLESICLKHIVVDEEDFEDFFSRSREAETKETWTPIGTEKCPFNGIFDGNNVPLVDLVVDTSEPCAGLFGRSSGTIKNVKIIGASVKSTNKWVGAIVGNGFTATITNCSVKGPVEIEGAYMVGGITGYTYGNVTGCTIDADNGSYIKGTYLKDDLEGDNIGGLVGYKGEGNSVIENCSISNVKVSGVRKVGGILGIMMYGNTVKNCNVNNVSVSYNGEGVPQDYNKVFSIGGAIGEIYPKENYVNTVDGIELEQVSVTGNENDTAACGLYFGSARDRKPMTEMSELVTVTDVSASNSNTVNADRKYDGIGATARIGDKYYASLEDAINAVDANGTIDLCADVKLKTGITVKKTAGFTLNGNGYSIAPAGIDYLGYQAVYFNGGTEATYNLNNIIFKDFARKNFDKGNNAPSGLVLRLENAKQFNLTDITFEHCDVANGISSAYSVMRIYNTNFEADNLTITGCEAALMMDIGPSSDSFNGKIIIKNSHITDNTAIGTALIYPMLKQGENSYLSISSSEFANNVIGDSDADAPQGRSVIHLASDTYIDNCIFDGNTVYGSHSSNVNYGINEFSGYNLEYTNNTFKNNTAYQTNQNLGAVSGLAMMGVGTLKVEGNIVENTNKFFNRHTKDEKYTEYPARSVGSYSTGYGLTTITSGTYYGALATFAGDESIEVFGGTFYSDVSQYVADGYYQSSSDGSFSVQETPATIINTAKMTGVEVTLNRLSNNSAIDHESGLTYKVVLDAAPEDDAKSVQEAIAKNNDTNTDKSFFDVSVIKTDSNGEMTDISKDITNQKVTITLGATPVGEVNVYHVTEENTEKISPVSVSDNKVSFIAPSFSTYAVTYNAGNISESEITGEISVVFEEAESGVYDIVLKAEEGKKINRFMSADLTFEYTPAFESGAMSYTVTPAMNVNLVEKENGRYEFNMSGSMMSSVTGAEICIGQVVFEGYGTGIFKVASVDVNTNEVHTAKSVDNIVDDYVVSGDGTTKGKLNLDSSVNVEIAVSTKKLKVVVSFPNAVTDNAKAYQDMTVTISGGDLSDKEEFNLGTDGKAMVDGSYTVEKELTQNVAYTVTVSGAGYRTARYTVTMTEDKTLKFWNNVMSEAVEVETGKPASAKNVTFLAGDIVKDNKINIYDLSAVVSYFGTSNDISGKSDYAKYDLNRDGKIDSKDVAYILVSWDK